METLLTKYPILLVHGLVLKKFLFFRPFGRIDKVLKKKGFVVYLSNNDGFGTIEGNASLIKEDVLRILQIENCEKVNIIAHSKGGLDAKYMIQHLDMNDKVASLTTLCTPHKGSPIATNILRLPKWLLKFIAFWINFWYTLFGDKHPDSLTVCHQLAESNDIEEETFFSGHNVYCQSYSTKMEKARNDFVMGIPFKFFHYFEKDKECDGLVSKESSIFGEYKGNAFNESISHAQITGFFAKKKKKEKVYAFYTELCSDLAKRGF